MHVVITICFKESENANSQVRALYTQHKHAHIKGNNDCEHEQTSERHMYRVPRRKNLAAARKEWHWQWWYQAHVSHDSCP